MIQAAPGLVIYRFGAGLYYANATRFTEEVLAILDEADPQVEWFCLSGASIGDVDYSGAQAISQVASEIKQHGAKFVVCELEPERRRHAEQVRLRAGGRRRLPVHRGRDRGIRQRAADNDLSA